MARINAGRASHPWHLGEAARRALSHSLPRTFRDLEPGGDLEGAVSRDCGGSRLGGVLAKAYSGLGSASCLITKRPQKNPGGDCSAAVQTLHGSSASGSIGTRCAALQRCHHFLCLPDLTSRHLRTAAACCWHGRDRIAVLRPGCCFEAAPEDPAHKLPAWVVSPSPG